MRRRFWMTLLTATLLLALAGLQVGCNRLTDRAVPTNTPTEAVATGVVGATPTLAAVTAEPGAGPPTLAISPLEAGVGDSVDVTATGFPPQSAVVIGFGRVNSEYDVIATLQADGGGAVAAQVTVPAFADPGDDWVFVAATEDNATKVVSDVFDVTGPQVAPAVTASPASGLTGSQVELAAQGFPANATVEIGFGRVNAEYDVVTAAQANADGEMTTTASVPAFATAADAWVGVVATADGQTRAISDVFEVEQLGGGAPTLTVSPVAAAPGTVVQLQARGFQPSTSLEIGFGRVSSEYDVLATSTTDEAGAASVELGVPDFADPEDAWVFIAAAEAMPTQSASASFDVLAGTPPATATPSSGLFTQASIHLVAIGDAGQSGQEIGCGDSIVPVTVQISPTIAPLTAAVEALLAIDTEFYGQSGLYNALHASSLTLNGINIVQGTATISLSGDLMLGGVCDNPRVEAQLEEIALQYSTVSQVEVLLNGVPLGQALSQQ